jgi:hypothetical protein
MSIESVNTNPSPDSQGRTQAAVEAEQKRAEQAERTLRDVDKYRRKMEERREKARQAARSQPRSRRARSGSGRGNRDWEIDSRTNSRRRQIAASSAEGRRSFESSSSGERPEGLGAGRGWRCERHPRVSEF